eukprot:Skav216197  [mRNA]  locus=scaffold1222:82006:83936:+ [translate_table: standard]
MNVARFTQPNLLIQGFLEKVQAFVTLEPHACSQNCREARLVELWGHGQDRLQGLFLAIRKVFNCMDHRAKAFRIRL